MKTAVLEVYSPTARKELLERCDRAIAAGRRIRETLSTTFDRAMELRDQIEMPHQDAISDGRAKGD
jgi:hypothetical protein